MRSLIILVLFALLISFLACGSEDGGGFAHPACSDGLDNDGDGAIDFPDDLSCNGESDTDEEGLKPDCDDGRDNDSDGRIDYPDDPGCSAPNQNDERDECPDGPSCPQCSDGKDNDDNKATDYPADSAGCTAASDNDEYTRNIVACGSNVTIELLPSDGHVAMGTISSTGASSLASPMCGGAGLEQVWELRVTKPTVIVATTDNPGTAIDTVLYLRGGNCSHSMSEVACNDNISTSNKKSTLTQSITTPGTYYLVVDAMSTAVSGKYELTVKYLTGEGETCAVADECGPGLVCRVLANGNQKVCAKHACEDGLEDDTDGKIDYPNDPGCASPKDDDESDSCPGAGPNCPECGDGVDNDGDGKTDFGSNGDTTCTSASNVSEACVAADGVTSLTMASTMGTTVGAVNDGKVACATSGTHTAPDKTYRLDLPAMASLTIETVNSFDSAIALYDATCGGTAIKCVEEEISSPEVLTVTDLAAGTYYFVVDGWSSTSGTYTLNVSGTIASNGRCDGPLATAGAISCAAGTTCTGTPKKCQ